MCQCQCPSQYRVVIDSIYIDHQTPMPIKPGLGAEVIDWTLVNLGQYGGTGSVGLKVLNWHETLERKESLSSCNGSEHLISEKEELRLEWDEAPGSNDPYKRAVIRRTIRIPATPKEQTCARTGAD